MTVMREAEGRQWTDAAAVRRSLRRRLGCGVGGASRLRRVIVAYARAAGDAICSSLRGARGLHLDPHQGDGEWASSAGVS